MNLKIYLPVWLLLVAGNITGPAVQNAHAAWSFAVANGTAGAPTIASVDWESFMAGNDMAWSRFPGAWNEAPHFGNAMLGSMLYKSGNAIRLQVFRADVHDHRDDTFGWPAYSRPRLNIGSFYLLPAGKLLDCAWRKNLWNAELTGDIVTDRGTIKIRHFVHAQDLAIVTELTTTGNEPPPTWTWKPEKAETTRSGYPKKASEIAAFAKSYGAHYEKTLQPYAANPGGIGGASGGVNYWQQDFLAGGQYAVCWKVRQMPDGTSVHLATIAHSYPEKTALARGCQDVENFAMADMAKWVAAHRAWWQAYYQRSFVAIPDPALERLYWQTIYRFGCISRTGRAFVDTPGIWFQGGGWAYTTTDWNIQCAHWGLPAANRLEQGMELLEAFHRKADELSKAVRPVAWQADSAYLPIAVASDMRGNREQDMRYYDLVGCLPWALNNCWMFYRYSMDDAMLREKLFPLLRRSVNLYLHMLAEGQDSKLHLPPTYSPETGTFKDCNFDLALLKWGCHALLNACRRLNIQDPLIPKWEEVIARTPDFPADKRGYMLGADKSSDPGHRHGSHLLMIYPLRLVNIEQGRNLDVAFTSYQNFNSIGGLPAMVQSHGGPMGAALGLGDTVLAGLHKQQKNLQPNGMWYSPPCLESSLSMANTIQELLLQSWCDPADRDMKSVIRIFPALPAAWQNVTFMDLRAEGSFLVSACRQDGVTTWVRIKSLAGEPCLVKPGFAGDMQVVGGRKFNLTASKNGLYIIDLRKDEEITLVGKQ